jgi:hypothetical protein
MSQYKRNMSYLHNNKVIYKRFPIQDQPTENYDWGWFYEEGTHECYELFRSKAKITTYKSLKWHLLVLWYLNPQITQDKFTELAEYIAKEQNGFVAFKLPKSILNKIIYDVSMMDLDRPPNNKQRKVIFKDSTGLTVNEKLSIVGKLIGRSKKATPEDIYDAMLYINDINKKITISGIAKSLNVTTRTVYRNMTDELKREKELLNQNNEKI